MVSLDLVRSSNAQLRELGPGLVALFVGGTSGIGELTLKTFVQNSPSPRVYFVGRNTEAANRIIVECAQSNKDAKLEFIKADVSELKEVDRVCEVIKSKEKRLNLLVQTQGNLNLNGKIESPEGLDRKFTLNFYSRARFTTNLLPLLRASTTQAPFFSRTLSVLRPGQEKSGIDVSDLGLKTGFSRMKCANHSIVMNDFFAEELAKRNEGITFMHADPGVVNTGIMRELPWWAKGVVWVLMPVLGLFLVRRRETGERGVFHATSGIYAPAKPVGETGAGVKPPVGLEVAVGSTGEKGSGAYLVHWNGDATPKNRSVLEAYREAGMGKLVWDHTMGVFEEVGKLNQKKASS